jgi:hypothetical protein
MDGEGEGESSTAIRSSSAPTSPFSSPPPPSFYSSFPPLCPPLLALLLPMMKSCFRGEGLATERSGAFGGRAAAEEPPTTAGSGRRWARNGRRQKGKDGGRLRPGGLPNAESAVGAPSCLSAAAASWLLLPDGFCCPKGRATVLIPGPSHAAGLTLSEMGQPNSQVHQGLG